jgi:hypothetical protein
LFGDVAGLFEQDQGPPQIVVKITGGHNGPQQNLGGGHLGIVFGWTDDGIAQTGYDNANSCVKIFIHGGWLLLGEVWSLLPLQDKPLFCKLIDFR